MSSEDPSLLLVGEFLERILVSTRGGSCAASGTSWGLHTNSTDDRGSSYTGTMRTGPWMPILMPDELTGMFLGGMLGTGGVPYWARRARMFGEPEIGEPSMFWLWGVPGRMFTGLVGVDMSAGGEGRVRRATVRIQGHVTPSLMSARR
jgi:hypothetical protein